MKRNGLPSRPGPLESLERHRLSGFPAEQRKCFAQTQARRPATRARAVGTNASSEWSSPQVTRKTLYTLSRKQGAKLFVYVLRLTLTNHKMERTMSWRTTTLLMVLSVLMVASGHAQTKTVAERLGYPEDSKLLIIHADDLAVAHSVDAASFDALDKNAVTSASVMVPCPWLNEVAAYAKDHPNADLGLHLTLTSEWKIYRWGPVAPSNQVAGLLGPDGTLWSDTPSVAQHAKPDEVEREIRAQVERAMAIGIHPTHFD